MPDKDTKGPRERSPRPSKQRGGLELGECEPSKKEDIQNLLEIHTGVETWGTPCITNLAELMGKTIPKTRREKVKLIRQAEQLIGSDKETKLKEVL